MLAVAVALYAVAITGMIVMALKFLRGAVPLGYHRTIIEQDGQVADGLTLVMTALYRIMSGAILAAALLMAALVLGPVWQGETWTVPVLTAAGLLIAVPIIVVPLRIERATGVRTPWRLGVLLVGFFLTAAIAALI